MSKTQTSADTRHDPRAIELVRDRLRHHCGKHAPRSQVMLAIACAGAWCDLSESETQAVLGWFEADPDPVEGVDYLPEPTPNRLSYSAIRAAEIASLRDEPVMHADVPEAYWRDAL